MYVKYQVLGKNHVAVPTHFFKIVILEKPRGDVELRSYVMPNMPVDEKIPLERFLVPIESIERASGLLFVPNIMKRTSGLKAITAGPWWVYTDYWGGMENKYLKMLIMSLLNIHKVTGDII